MGTFLDAPEFAGIRRAINPGAGDNWEPPFQEEVDDDVDGEKETFVWDDIPGLVDPDDGSDDEDDKDKQDNSVAEGEGKGSGGDTKMLDVSAMRGVLAEASKGVADSTDAEYKRLIIAAEKFVHSENLLKDGESLFTNKPHEDAAWFIVAWIMNR
ncbi:hypothetical protein B0H10DRAFT_2247293 [Mycena sp. CBHHK59/15]|nr:hypothetical protein B0H10DRAFT_2247293 [Mycena sp. CBHHK59/15]